MFIDIRIFLSILSHIFKNYSRRNNSAFIRKEQVKSKGEILRLILMIG